MTSTRVAPEYQRLKPKQARPSCIGEMIRDQMSGLASNIFIREEKVPGNWNAGQATITFEQALQQAKVFAAALESIGIGHGMRVAVFCSNGAEYTLGVLGCHLHGACAIVREPDMPNGELVAVTRATKPHLMMLSPVQSAIDEFITTMAGLEGGAARKVVPWTTAGAMAGDSDMLLMKAGHSTGGDFPGRGHPFEPKVSYVVSAVPPETNTLICMTSGTTGTPKGVMHTAGGLAYLMYDVMDPQWYNEQILGAPRMEGDLRPTVLSQQSGYISGHLVVLAAVQLHLCLIFAGTEELRGWLKNGWPETARPVVQMLLPAVITTIWKNASDKLANKGFLARYLVKKLLASKKGVVEANANSPDDTKGLGFVGGLAYKKIGGKIRNALGGQCRLLVTGGAKPDISMLQFFWSCGLPIYEGFASTEVLLAVLNLPGKRKLGTAGTAPHPGINIKLNEKSEICVKSPMVMTGYFEQPAITAESFDAEGFFKTGDKGEWRDGSDGEKYLAITGRIKDMIILDQRENVWPETLEGVFKRSGLIADCVIPMSCEGPDRSYLIMIVALADSSCTDDQLKAQLAEFGSAAGIQKHEYPLAFVRSAFPFTKDNGFRNANHKLLRKKIDSHFKTEIDEVYAVKAAPSDSWVP